MFVVNQVLWNNEMSEKVAEIYLLEAFESEGLQKVHYGARILNNNHQKARSPL